MRELSWSIEKVPAQVSRVVCREKGRANAGHRVPSIWRGGAKSRPRASLCGAERQSTWSSSESLGWILESAAGDGIAWRRVFS